MKNKNEQISSQNLMFTVACYFQSTALFIGFASSVAKQDTWIILIIGFIITLPIIWMDLSLSERFPGKSLIEINDIVFGKIIGKFCSLMYIFFFFSLTILNANVFGDFVIGSLLPETPALIVYIMIMFVCCYAVLKGPQVITYYSVLFFLMTIGVVLFNTVSLIKDMKFSNFQPLFALPPIKYIQSTQTIVFLTFSEVIVFFMLFPNFKKTTDIKKPLFGGIIIGFATILFIVLRNISVLGPLMSYLTNPSFEVVRLVDIGDIFTRMEILYATILTILIFFKVSILFYATLKGLEQLLNLNSYKPFVPIIGVLAVYAALTVFDSSFEHAFWGSNVASIYSMFFVFILPLITFIVALLRGFRKDKGGNTL